MAWKIDFQKSALKDIKSLARQDQARVISFMQDKVAKYDDPTDTGKPLVGGSLVGSWRYRVGDIRVICIIDKKSHSIYVQQVGRRDTIYGFEEDEVE